MVDDTKRLDGNGLARVWTATQKLVADNINDGVPVNGVVEFDGLEADIPDGYTKIGTRDSRLLIKKGEKTIPVRSTVVNEETASDTDVYSCEYINDKLEDIEDAFSGVIPQGEIVVESIRSKNINSKTLVQGLYQVSDGTINRGYSGYVTLDGFLPISYNETITISNKNNVSGTYFVLEYDSNMQYLNQNQNAAGTTATFTIVNPNTKYIAIDLGSSGATPQTIGNFQVELGETATNYAPYQNLDMKDSGWIFPTLNSDFTNYDTNDNHTKYRKVGNIITITGHIKTTTDLVSTSQQVIFTLPQEFRPLNEIQTLCQGSGMYHWLLTIRQNGDVTISRYGIDSQDTITTSAWLPFNVIYMI